VVGVDRRKRHKRKMMIRGGEILGLDFVLEDCVWGRNVEKEKGENEEINEGIQTWI